MKLLTIASDRSIDLISSKIKRQLMPYLNEGIEIEEEVSFGEPFYYIEYSVKIESINHYPLSDFLSIFKYSIANALWDYIQCYEENQLITKILNQEYDYFDEREKLEIERNAMDLLKEESEEALLINQEAYSRKSRVLKRLMDHLNEQIEINIRGFITFSLKDYMMDLEETVERAIEDFISNKEYNDFIKLLKYFVDIQDSKVKIIHLVLDQDHRYKLYDEQYQLINNDYLREIASEITENNFLSYEDILMSALITMAPEQIMIHQFPGMGKTEVIKTINRVFASKVTLCNGCELCSIESNLGKE
ncbi:sporulation protein YtxC [Alkaliphilus crotonatoxidans]